MSSVSFVHAKKRTRGELRLPQLHFVAVDDWVDKLGDRAFVAWLKFYSWADRSDPDRDFDNIPNSLNTVVKRLGISKTTFYEKVIRPLWEYGFIDFQPYEKDRTVHLNIVVYEYPQNDPKMATSPIEKIRDYDKDYHSPARVYGKMGGTKSAQSRLRYEQGEHEGVVQNLDQGGGSKIEPGVVQELDHGGQKNGPINDQRRSNVIENINDLKIDQSIDHTTIEMVIQSIIDSDDRLTDRRDSILTIYNIVKKELNYSDTLFLYTLKKVLDADVKTSFENYLLRALINNMSLMQKDEPDDSTLKRRRVQPLPSSVVEQLAKEEASATIDVEAINTRMDNETFVQKQLRALEMLLQLGDISQEKYETERARLTKKFHT